MRNRGSHQKGAALVEFALILPLLVMLIFGIIEFSVMLYDKAVITNASREAARAGIVYSYPNKITDDEIKGIITKYCGTHLISLGQSSVIDMLLKKDTTPQGDRLTVRVTYPYYFLVLPSFITSLAGPITLDAESVMRYE